MALVGPVHYVIALELASRRLRAGCTLTSRSEFPSLSGNQQQQFQAPGQAVWSNQRPAQHAAIQRPQNAQQAPQAAHPSSNQGQHEDFFSSGMDDFRHGNQSGIGQLPSSTNNPQPGSVDDFPPLGRMGLGEIGQDRRMSMMQNAASTNYASGSGLAPGKWSDQNSRQIQTHSDGEGSSRSPGDMLRQPQDKNVRPRGSC